MSNWAKLQEDLMGKPVFKRARHGIHFKNNDGSITANFSGKPCHYEDGGIWKPIDTKLVLLPDGFYGCPHSKVKVHPDGRVAVAGTDYAQRVELPSAKTGLADGDKLIREFSFGKQEMRITETGFRSEITLNRIPTLTEARKLISSESGALPGKYRKSDTTATDANGSVHTYSTLAAFRTWLAKAVFPVVIDPDFSVQPDAAAGQDGFIESGAASKNNGVSPRIDVGKLASLASIRRGLIKFADPELPAGSTISSTILSLCPVLDYSTNAREHSIFRLKRAWVEGTRSDADDNPATGATWKRYDTTSNWQTAGGFGADDCEQTRIGYRSMTATETLNEMKEFPLTGTTWSELDLGNGWLIKAETENDDAYLYASSDHATESYRPVLTVTYTASGIAIPVAQYYYNRLRRN